MQEVQQTPRDFLRSIGEGVHPHTALIEWGKRNTGGLSLEEIKRAEMEKREEERRRRTGELPTLYNMPAIKSPPLNTTEMIAQVLSLPAGDVFVEKVTTGNTDILVLIHQAVEELNSAPMLVVVSNLQYAANEKLLMRYRYYYLGVWIPIISSSEVCSFDVRVYGASV